MTVADHYSRTVPSGMDYIITQKNMYQVLTNHFAYILFSRNSQITLPNITDLF